MSCAYLDHFKRGDVVGAGNVDEVDVACEETVSQASQEARGEDGDEGVRPESHHHPGEHAGHSRGDQQLLGAKPLLQETTSQSEYDGRDILSYSNDGIS